MKVSVGAGVGLGPCLITVISRACECSGIAVLANCKIRSSAGAVLSSII
jgi:hypothetical protein